MKKSIKTAVTAELTTTEMSLVSAYQVEHGCSRMAAIRELIRGSNEEQRMSKELQLLSARVDSLSVRVNGMTEILHQLTSFARDIRLGTAYNKIAMEVLLRDKPEKFELISQRYEAFKK